MRRKALSSPVPSLICAIQHTNYIDVDWLQVRIQDFCTGGFIHKPNNLLPTSRSDCKILGAAPIASNGLKSVRSDSWEQIYFTQIDLVVNEAVSGGRWGPISDDFAAPNAFKVQSCITVENIWVTNSGGRGARHPHCPLDPHLGSQSW